MSSSFLYSWLFLVPLNRSEPKFKIYCGPKGVKCRIFTGTSIHANINISLASCASECTVASLIKMMPFVWMTFLSVYPAFHNGFMSTVLHSKLLFPILRTWNSWFALQDIFAGRSASAAREHLLFFNFSIDKTEKNCWDQLCLLLIKCTVWITLNNILYYSHGSLILSTV